MIQTQSDSKIILYDGRDNLLTTIVGSFNWLYDNELTLYQDIQGMDLSICVQSNPFNIMVVNAIPYLGDWWHRHVQSHRFENSFSDDCLELKLLTLRDHQKYIWNYKQKEGVIFCSHNLTRKIFDKYDFGKDKKAQCFYGQKSKEDVVQEMDGFLYIPGLHARCMVSVEDSEAVITSYGFLSEDVGQKAEQAHIGVWLRDEQKSKQLFDIYSNISTVRTL